MKHRQVALSINVSRADTAFMVQTITHLVRACHYPFAERTLVVETAPMHPRYEGNPLMGTEAKLTECCEQLVEAGVVDRVLPIDYRAATVNATYEKHLGKVTPERQDFRGAPFYGYMFAYESSQHEYFLHFDSDMLLHQKRGHDWITRAIDFMESAPEIGSVTPLPGPPAPESRLKQPGRSYERDPRGFFRFSAWTSRRFLLSRSRFEALLPLTIPAPLAPINGLTAWERCVAATFERDGLVRADLDSPDAWTLHNVDHGTEFIEMLPKIIERVEAGDFPAEQAGDYDLRLELWRGTGTRCPS
jgi:hypothetical protein